MRNAVDEVAGMSAARLDPHTLGVAIARLRAGLHLDQTAFAEKTGMSRAYISRLERGHVDNPSVYHLERVADALGVSLATLVSPLSPSREYHFRGDLEAIEREIEALPTAEAEAILRGLRQTLAFARDLRRARSH